jgi:predicted alpha/beta-hydrolase family hydrolase
MSSVESGVVILTHGAGSNRDAPLLVALDRALSHPGLAVQRINLYFRDQRPTGPPFRHDAAKDRAGIREAAQSARASGAGRVCLGGHSYGGRQATVAAAENPALADALLLLSYPLHPPRKPEQLRTSHFPDLRSPALFVHGSRDPFGAIPEIERAIGEIAAPTELLVIEGAGHDLIGRKPLGAVKVAEMVAEAFLRFLSAVTGSPV